MDVILKVLKGAKEGTKIAIKKDRFLIGRSRKCHLCVGSTSISRRHCAITRDQATVSVEDLGSRNGTLVNGQRIEEQVELHSGDELTIGSLKLLVAVSPGINNLKRPKVKTVADAVERTADAQQSEVLEDDISSWLIGSPDTSEAVTETQTIRLDDTNAIRHQIAPPENADEEASTPTEAPQDESEQLEEDAVVDQDELSEEEDDSKKKKGPGKLPPVPDKPASKDSREAAMDALRAWNRRR